MAVESHLHMPLAYAIKPSSEKPQIPQPAAQLPRCSGPTTSSRLVSLLPAACLAFMLYSSFTAVVDSHGDPSTIFFVVSSLSILGLLYLSMRGFERAVAEKKDAKRDKLKIAIWSLAMLLNMLFSYRVTSVLQSPVMSCVVWGIAAITSFVGCVLLFFLPQPSTVKGEPLQPRTVADPEEGVQ